jgi:FkbM family methyltransferase
MVSFLKVVKDIVVERQPEAAKYLMPSSFFGKSIRVRGITIPLPQRKVLREAVFTQSYSLISDNAFKYISRDRQPKYILDLGASYGIIAANFATMYPNAHVFAFEPDPQGYGYARTLLDVNRITNVTLSNVAVDTQSGSRDFHVNRERSEYSSFYGNEANTGENSNTMKVECVDIAEFIESHNIDRVDILKVDIEGAEFTIFDHLDKQNLWAIVDNVFAEIHLDYGNYENTRLSSLIAVLEDNGYFLKVHSTGSDSTLSRLLLWGSKDAIVT